MYKHAYTLTHEDAYTYLRFLLPCILLECGKDHVDALLVHILSLCLLWLWLIQVAQAESNVLAIPCLQKEHLQWGHWNRDCIPLLWFSLTSLIGPAFVRPVNVYSSLLRVNLDWVDYMVPSLLFFHSLFSCHFYQSLPITPRLHHVMPVSKYYLYLNIPYV